MNSLEKNINELLGMVKTAEQTISTKLKKERFL